MTPEKLHAIRDDAKAALEFCHQNAGHPRLDKNFTGIAQNVLDLVAEVERLKREHGELPRALTPAEETLRRFQSPTGSIVLWFAEQMERQLEANRHKGNAEGWRTMHPWELVECLLDQTVSVQELFEHNGATITVADFARLIRKCMNVANYAMMLADQANEALRQQRATGEASSVAKAMEDKS